MTKRFSDAAAGALRAGLEVEPVGMANPRTSSALRQLTALGRDPAPSRWVWAVRTYEPGGRLRLPAVAQAAVRFRPGALFEVRSVIQASAPVHLSYGLDSTRGVFRCGATLRGRRSP